MINAWLPRLTAFDRKLSVILALLVLLSFLLLLWQSPGSKLLVEVAGKTVFVADLQQDQEIRVAGLLGPTRLKIEAGAVSVVSSPCPQKTCIGFGEISAAGDLLACLPNRVVARIEGDGRAREQAYDALSR